MARELRVLDGPFDGLFERRSEEEAGQIAGLAQVRSHHHSSDRLPRELGEKDRVPGDVCRLAQRLQDALPLLSPLEAEVFSLSCFEDKSNGEIALMLGKTPNHVGVTLHAARKKLREALATSASIPLHQTEGGLAP